MKRAKVAIPLTLIAIGAGLLAYRELAATPLDEPVTPTHYLTQLYYCERHHDSERRRCTDRMIEFVDTIAAMVEEDRTYRAMFCSRGPDALRLADRSDPRVPLAHKRIKDICCDPRPHYSHASEEYCHPDGR